MPNIVLFNIICIRLAHTERYGQGFRKRIWFSPQCLTISNKYLRLPFISAFAGYRDKRQFSFIKTLLYEQKTMRATTKKSRRTIITG